MLVATEHIVFAWPGGTSQCEPEPIVQDASVQGVAEAKESRAIVVDGAMWLERAEEKRRVETGKVCAKSILILDEQPLKVLLGTHAAHLYLLTEPSLRASCIDSFERLSCREKWLTPWGGPPAVRSLAASSDSRTVYADIHVGSIMRSNDGGDTWEPVTPQLDDDVHQVTTSRSATRRVYANTASSVYLSDDRGQSWSHRHKGLNARYGRAIAVHPNDPDCILASVSDGPHGGNGQLYRSDDAGENWTHVTDGFPAQSDRNIDTFQLIFGPDGNAWASIARELYRSADRGRSWSTVWTSPEQIQYLACGR